MNAGTLEVLRYNARANTRLLDACRPVTEQQLDARLDFASGPVHELLVHLVGAEQTYVLRTQGRQHEGELNRISPWPGITELACLGYGMERRAAALPLGRHWWLWPACSADRMMRHYRHTQGGLR